MNVRSIIVFCLRRKVIEVNREVFAVHGLEDDVSRFVFKLSFEGFGVFGWFVGIPFAWFCLCAFFFLCGMFWHGYF